MNIVSVYCCPDNWRRGVISYEQSKCVFDRDELEMRSDFQYEYVNCRSDFIQTIGRRGIF